MPTEFRFDDLDLREEPGHAMAQENDYTAACSRYCTVQSQNCTKTAQCTVVCCTDAC